MSLRSSKAVVTILGIAVLLVVGSSRAPGFPWGKKDEETRPILLVGLDGMEWDVVLPLLRAGRLPNLQALMERGIGGELESMKPTVSPTIWTTIATGMSGPIHGIRGFVKPTEDRDENPELHTSRDRLVKAFWNILSEADRVVTVIGWWNTYPAEPVNGLMVAQVNTLGPNENRVTKEVWKGSLLEGLEGQVYPPQLQPEILAQLPAADEEMPALLARAFGEFTLPMDSLEARLWQNCEWSFRSDATYHRIALDRLSKELPFDLFAVYYGGTDVAGHRFWRYHEPEKYTHRPSEKNVEEFGTVISDYYVQIDGMVGELVAAAPEDCNVLVVSDHGMYATRVTRPFEADYPMRGLVSGHHKEAPAGFFAAAGPDIRPVGLPVPVGEITREDLASPGSVFDVTPTLLALLALPVGEDMEGGVMEELLIPEFLEKNPVRWVSTHTPDDWWETRQISGDQPFLPEERLQQLRDLGYIE